jgi:hypothetical protein
LELHIHHRNGIDPRQGLQKKSPMFKKAAHSLKGMYKTAKKSATGGGGGGGSTSSSHSRRTPEWTKSNTSPKPNRPATIQTLGEEHILSMPSIVQPPPTVKSGARTSTTKGEKAGGTTPKLGKYLEESSPTNSKDQQQLQQEDDVGTLQRDSTIDSQIRMTGIVWKRRSGLGKYSVSAAWERQRVILLGRKLV